MRKKLIFTAVLIAVLGVLFLVLGVDYSIETTFYTVKNEHSNEKIRIALITDLHSCHYGKNQKEILDAIRAQNPDMVLFGGDIIDDRLPEENAVIVLTELAKDYECYYVSGNHENYTERVEEIKDLVRSCGVTVLEETNRKMYSPTDFETIDIYGIDDKDIYTWSYNYIDHIKASTENDYFSNSFNILLAHRPEFPEEYSEIGFDLVLSGHAHGGQWRIPGILEGFYAPDQGFFPKNSGGIYELNGTTMIVSRGLAKESTRLPRIFNRPELVIIDII